MSGMPRCLPADQTRPPPQACHHQLLAILVIAFCTSRCGAESCLEMAGFALSEEEVLCQFLDREGSPPSHDPFRRVFRLLDPARFAACWPAYLDQLGAVCRGPVVLAGKTLRGAHDQVAGVSPLPRVSAFASEPRLTLGQIAVEAHSNEILAGRALSSLLSLQACPVRLEALHTQRETAQA